jgi:hypothetical protein
MLSHVGTLPWTRDSVYTCHEMYTGFAVTGLILILNKLGGIIGDSEVSEPFIILIL